MNPFVDVSGNRRSALGTHVSLEGHRVQLIRIHGVLGPNAALRSAPVSQPAQGEAQPADQTFIRDGRLSASTQVIVGHIEVAYS